MKEGYTYQDRCSAGQVLAEQLKPLVNGAAIVLSLPRGGSIVGAEVAKALKAEHDLIISRKIGAPFNPEVAIGAMTQDGKLLKDDSIINALAITNGYLESQSRLVYKEIQRRLKELRGDKPFPSLRNKTAILVDDGLATGFTMEAAIEFIRSRGSASIVVAVPVGSAESIAKISPKVDRIVCPLVPESFWAVGNFYQDFHQISDEEVKALFKEEGYHEENRCR